MPSYDNLKAPGKGRRKATRTRRGKGKSPLVPKPPQSSMAATAPKRPVGRSAASPGHLKKAAGVKSARSFAPGHTKRGGAASPLPRANPMPGAGAGSSITSKAPKAAKSPSYGWPGETTVKFAGNLTPKAPVKRARQSPKKRGSRGMGL